MIEQVSHYCWEDQPVERILGSIDRRFVTSRNIMIGQVCLQKGTVVPPHRHANEQFTHVIKGVMRFVLGDGQDTKKVVRAGELIFIPSNLLHGVEILEDTLEYDIFNPPRQDWINGSSDIFSRR